MNAAQVLDARRHGEASHAPTPRRLVVTWQHPYERGIHPIGFLTFDGRRYEFRYTRNALNVDGFAPLIGFPDLGRAYASDTLFALFAQRAMDPRRPDFERYVTRLGLPADSTPWEQIARSGGRRAGDSLQLFPVPTIRSGHMTCAFLVHGIRHIGRNPLLLEDGPLAVTRDEVEQSLSALRPGDELGLLPEPGNPVNSRALLVTADGTPVGYVPNLLVDDLVELQERTAVRALAEIVNGPEAPWHLRVLGRLEADKVGDFQFFTAPSWEALSAQ
jgi:hypothetical protein